MGSGKVPSNRVRYEWGSFFTRACCPSSPHGRDKSGPYISRNKLRENDDESGLCDEQPARLPVNDGEKMHTLHTCIVRKMSIHCQSCQGPIYRTRIYREGWKRRRSCSFRIVSLARGVIFVRSVILVKTVILVIMYCNQRVSNLHSQSYYVAI